MAKFLKFNFNIFSRFTMDQDPHSLLSDFESTSIISQTELILEKSSSSNGLQLSDLFIWILARKYNNKDISNLDQLLLNEVMNRSFTDGNTLQNHATFLKNYNER